MLAPKKPGHRKSTDARPAKGGTGKIEMSTAGAGGQLDHQPPDRGRSYRI